MMAVAALSGSVPSYDISFHQSGHREATQVLLVLIGSTRINATAHKDNGIETYSQ